MAIFNLSPGSVVAGLTALTAGVASSNPNTIGTQFTASVAGTVNVTMLNGSTGTLTLAVGDNIYPYGITTYTAGTATITAAYSLTAS